MQPKQYPLRHINQSATENRRNIPNLCNSNGEINPKLT